MLSDMKCILFSSNLLIYLKPIHNECEVVMFGKGGSCVLYLSMPQSCEEATYFS